MQTLIFDFDGTIADSFGTMLNIFEQLTKRAQPLSAEEIEHLQGQPLSTIVHELNIPKWQIPKLVIQGRRAIGARIGEVTSFEGMPAALKQLHDAGYQMSILSSNSPSNINRFLLRNQLGGYFTAIHGNVGVLGKAAALKKVIKKERLVRQDCLYIGDVTGDIEASRKAGIACLAVGWGFNTPPVLKRLQPAGFVPRPAELPAAVARLLPIDGGDV